MAIGPISGALGLHQTAELADTGRAMDNSADSPANFGQGSDDAPSSPIPVPTTASLPVPLEAEGPLPPPSLMIGGDEAQVALEIQRRRSRLATLTAEEAELRAHQAQLFTSDVAVEGVPEERLFEVQEERRVRVIELDALLQLQRRLHNERAQRQHQRQFEEQPHSQTHGHPALHGLPPRHVAGGPAGAAPGTAPRAVAGVAPGTAPRAFGRAAPGKAPRAVRGAAAAAGGFAAAELGGVTDAHAPPPAEALPGDFGGVAAATLPQIHPSPGARMPSSPGPASHQAVGSGHAKIPQPTSTPPRQMPRVPLAVEVDFSGDTNLYVGFSENLSEGGIFVATYTPRQVGEQFDISFTMPGVVKAITCAVVVTWSVPFRDKIDDEHSERVPGMGLKFLNLSKQQAALLAAFVAQREPLFYPG